MLRNSILRLAKSIPTHAQKSVAINGKFYIIEIFFFSQKNRIKSNNMWITGAIVSAGGQFFREVASNWNLEEFKDITYQRILGMGARYFAGQIIN